MITSEQVIQLKAFARQDGAIMGLLWIASFVCFAMSQTQPLLSFAFDISIVGIPYVAAAFARRYRDAVLGGCISFRRCFFYVQLIFLYATLILAIGQWAYFEFVDHGQLVGGMMKSINSPEFQPVLEAYRYSKEEVNKQMEMLTQTRPIDFALTFVWVNVIAGTILAWIIALFTKRTKQKTAQ